MKWTREDEQTLETLWGTMPAPRIASILNRSSCAIIGKANRMGLRPIKAELRHEWLRQGYRRWMAAAGVSDVRR